MIKIEETLRKSAEILLPNPHCCPSVNRVLHIPFLQILFQRKPDVSKPFIVFYLICPQEREFRGDIRGPEPAPNSRPPRRTGAARQPRSLRQPPNNADALPRDTRGCRLKGAFIISTLSSCIIICLGSEFRRQIHSPLFLLYHYMYSVVMPKVGNIDRFTEVKTVGFCHLVDLMSYFKGMLMIA
jgi:hypothetical protein